jgi:hypothetical protein
MAAAANSIRNVAWLRIGDHEISKSSDPAAATLEFFGLLKSLTKKRGETMTTQTFHDPRYPACERAQRMQDVLLVSSFALWAMLLGFAPVLTCRLLMGS